MSSSSPKCCHSAILIELNHIIKTQKGENSRETDTKTRNIDNYRLWTVSNLKSLEEGAYTGIIGHGLDHELKLDKQVHLVPNDTVHHDNVTCPCNVDPLTAHFYIVKVGFTVVYIIFLLCSKT